MVRINYSQVSTHPVYGSRPWHGSAVQFQALSTCICLAMFTCFAISASRGGAVGTTELFSGQCSYAVDINRVLQAILAVLAIGISISFDFFMRLASSPTIDDLRDAHSQGRSLDIAIHSLRNIRHITGWRTFGWITLILLAIPIQLFSHSIAFVSFSTTGYSRILASEAFTTGQPMAYPGVGLLNLPLTEEVRSQFYEILPKFELASREWDKLEVSDCKRIYSQDIKGLQSHRNVLFVIEAGPNKDAKGWTSAQVWDGESYLAFGENETYFPFREYDSRLENSLWSFAMYCEVNRNDYSNNRGNTACNISYENAHSWDIYAPEAWGEGTVENTSNTSWLSTPARRDDYSTIRETFQIPRIKYCLSEPYSAPCKVYVSNFFLLVTTLCILLGCTCSTLISRLCWHKETCQSIGDALQAFLKDGETFIQMPSALPTGYNPEGTAPPSTRWTPVSMWKEARPRFGQAISKKMWMWTYVPIGIILVAGSAALGVLGKSVLYDYTLGESLSNRISLVKDPVTHYAFAPSNGTLKLAIHCLIVNSPQLSISICYFTFSSFYSALFQAKCWADLSIKPHPLRVSFPRGEQQEGTPALQFPWVWGLSFIFLKAAIGWSLTQSFYLVPHGKVSMWHNDFKVENVETFIGYSMRAMILTVAIAAVAALIPVLLSLRHLPRVSVVVGTDSAAIAAYCPTNKIDVRHQASAEGQQGAIAAWDDVWRSRRHLQPLRWGVLNLGSTTLGRPGVLGLGTEDEVLGQPVEGQMYVSVAGHFKLYMPSALEMARPSM